MAARRSLRRIVRTEIRRDCSLLTIQPTQIANALLERYIRDQSVRRFDSERFTAYSSTAYSSVTHSITFRRLQPQHVYSPNGILVSPIQNRLLARASIPGPRPSSRARAS
jgi:hypothetical protein